MRLALLAILLSAFPSVRVGMTRAEAVKAIATDGLLVCESITLPSPDPLLGGATSGVLACRKCPCPAQLGSLVVWFSKADKVTGVAVVQPRAEGPVEPGRAPPLAHCAQLQHSENKKAPEVLSGGLLH